MMESDSKIESIAKDLLHRYGSRKEVSHHSVELIQQYGQVDYARIIQVVKQIVSQAVLSSRSPEEKERMELIQSVRLKEEDLLRSRFKKGARYAFIISQKYSRSDSGIVKDQYGNEHPVVLPQRYVVGDKISCIVRGYRIFITKTGKITASYLELDLPRKISINTSLDAFTPIPPRRYIKSPSKWASEVEGLGKHICGKPFICSCCGQSFPAKKGYRIDLKDIYFCMDCKREIFPPSGRGWKGRIISTPMGNKR